MTQESYHKLFGALVRLRRVEKGWDQPTFEKKCNVTRPVFSLIERGQKPNKDSTAAKITAALDISERQLAILKETAKAIDPDCGIIPILNSHIPTESLERLLERASFASGRMPDTTPLSGDISIQTRMLRRTAWVIASTEHNFKPAVPAL